MHQGSERKRGAPVLCSGLAMGSKDATTRVRPFRPHGAAADHLVPCLEGLTGGHAGHTIPLREGITIIGRAAVGHLSLDDDGVSRRHAKIVVSPDGMTTLFDLESTNGTLVNGAPIARIGLREGDRVQIGPSVAFRFTVRAAGELRASAAAAAEAPPETRGQADVPLTARELEIARLVVEGMSNDQIAARLHVSSRTVGTHLANVYRRLEIHTRAELTRLIVERGLLGRRP
jgi:DNA-binding CsgD family transcriptional regulator